MKSLFALLAAVCAFAVIAPTSAEAGFLGIRIGVGGGHYCAPHYGGGYGGGYYRSNYPVRVYSSSYYGGGYNRVQCSPRGYYGGGGYRAYPVSRLRYVNRGYYGRSGYYVPGGYYGGGRYFH